MYDMYVIAISTVYKYLVLGQCAQVASEEFIPDIGTPTPSSQPMSLDFMSQHVQYGCANQTKYGYIMYIAHY